jgi:hypothetical protein
MAFNFFRNFSGKKQEEKSAWNKAYEGAEELEPEKAKPKPKPKPKPKDKAVADLSEATNYLRTANVGPLTKANPGNPSGTGLLGGRRKTRKSRKRKTKKHNRR